MGFRVALEKLLASSPPVSGLMYGYTLSGAETAGSAFANLTGNPIPDGFSKSIIPSLLFGSLISATDPGEGSVGVRVCVRACVCGVCVCV